MGLDFVIANLQWNQLFWQEKFSENSNILNAKKGVIRSILVYGFHTPNVAVFFSGNDARENAQPDWFVASTVDEAAQLSDERCFDPH